VGVIQQGLGAGQTEDVAELLHRIEELIQIDRAGQLDVSKVTRAILVGQLACRADLAVLNHAEARIEHAIGNCLGGLICLVSCDLDHAALQDVVRISDTKLNTDDCVTHFTSCYVFAYIIRFYRRATTRVAFHNASFSTMRITGSSP